MLEGSYKTDCAHASDQELLVSCGLKRGQKKHFKRNKKEYKRLSEHIGLIPIVMISPKDNWLIEGGSEERRRLLDVSISQLDRNYINALTATAMPCSSATPCSDRRRNQMSTSWPSGKSRWRPRARPSSAAGKPL